MHSTAVRKVEKSNIKVNFYEKFCHCRAKKKSLFNRPLILFCARYIQRVEKDFIDILLLHSLRLRGGWERTHYTRGALDFTSYIIAERGGIPESCCCELFIDCLLQKKTFGVLQANKRGLVKGKILFICKAPRYHVVEKFINCLGGCKNQRWNKKKEEIFWTLKAFINQMNATRTENAIYITCTSSASAGKRCHSRNA